MHLGTKPYKQYRLQNLRMMRLWKRFMEMFFHNDIVPVKFTCRIPEPRTCKWECVVGSLDGLLLLLNKSLCGLRSDDA